MTQVPTIDKILYKNRLADYIRRGPGMKLLQLAGNAIGKRKASLATGESSSSDQHGQPKDFLAHFLEAQSNNSSIPPW